MPIETLIVTRLADLRVGDRIVSWGGHPYNPPRVVQVELAPIEPGSPVRGVRLENPTPGGVVEYVLYPSQMDGRQLEVTRESHRNNSITGPVGGAGPSRPGPASSGARPATLAHP